jgi:hypothetical protein
MKSRKTVGPSSCGEMFENLEARVLLSGDYYTHQSLDEIAGADMDWVDVAGITSGGSLIWGWDEAEDGSFIATRDRVWTPADLPLLADSDIISLTDSGVALAHDAVEDRYYLLDIHDPTERQYFDELDFDAGWFGTDDFVPLAYLDDGDFLLQTDALVNGNYELWLLRDAQAQFLWSCGSCWSGKPMLADYTADSVIVGHSQSGDDVVPVLWSDATGLINLHGLERVQQVNSNGLAAGRTDDRYIAIWQDDGLTVTSMVNDPDTFVGHQYTVEQIDDQGRMLVEFESWNKGTGTEIEILLVEGQQQIRLKHHAFNLDYEGASHDSAFDPEFLMSDTGTLAFNGYLDIIPLADLLPSQAGYPVALGAQNATATLVTYGYNGRQLTMHADAGGVVDWNFSTGTDQLERFWDEPNMQFSTYIDPRSGGVILVLVDPNANMHDAPGTYQPYLIPIDPNRGVTTQGTPYRKIQSGVTSFVSTDHRAHIAGLGEDGDLMLYFDARIRNEWRWAFSNMTEDLFDPRGIETPDFVGQLTSFSTRWGAMNIVGLDSSGDVQTAWWSRSSHGWQVANLSNLTDAPRLTGAITATTTPWGAMQIFGTDGQGHLIALWWAPDAAGWHWNDITAITSGAALDPGSLSVQLLPWKSMAIVGKTTDNEIAAYWWTPSTRWVYESISQDLGISAPDITGPVSYQTTVSGTQHIAGIDDEGHVIQIYWMPHSVGWQLQDLTEMAGG